MRSKLFQSSVTLTAILSLLAGLLTGCGAPPTNTPVPSDTPVPTPSPVPTDTPVPTATPLPLAEWIQEGEALRLKSDYADAEEAFQRVLEADPANVAAHLGLSMLYLRQLGREELALESAQQAVDLAPDSAEAHAALAQARGALLDGSEALAAAEKAVALDAKSAAAQIALAEAYRLDRQIDKALEAAEQAVALAPEQGAAWEVLASVYSDIADFGRARVAYEKAVALEPDYAHWHDALAQLLARLDQTSKAIAEFQRAMALAPDDLHARLGLARVFIDRSRFAEANQIIQRATELAPELPDPILTAAYYQQEQGESDKAIELFRQAARQDADSYAAQAGLAHAYLQDGECNAAQLQAEKLLELQPRFAEGRIVQGLARLCDGDAGKALEQFRKARDLEPFNEWATIGLARAYAYQERWEEAVLSAVDALKVAAAPAFIHSEIASIYNDQEEFELAEAEYETALRLNPNLFEASVGLAAIYLQQNRYAEAQAQAGRALQLRRLNVLASWVLAVALLYQGGQAARAGDLLLGVLATEPEDAIDHYWLGVALRDLEQYADAKKEFETYQTLSGDDSDFRLSALIKALDQGYVLDDAKGVTEVQDTLEGVLDKKVEAKVEGGEGQPRTLLITFDRGADQPDASVLEHMRYAMWVASLTIPRIRPVVDQGAVVHVREKGKPAYTMTAALQDLTVFGEAAIGSDTLETKMSFSRIAAGGAQASVAQLESDVAELRELAPKSKVPFKALDEEGLKQHVSSSLDAEARASMNSSDALLTLLGVLTPDQELEQIMTDLYTEQIAGFYDPKEGAFYLVEREEQSANDQLTIAHEYTHALQDQHFGLDPNGEEEQNGDQSLAFDALLEGDATLAMYQYAGEHVGVFDFAEARSKAAGMESEALDASPEFIRRLDLFPYEEGLKFVQALYQGGGWPAIDEAYAQPPQSTEQILHPDRYRSGDTPEAVKLPDLAAALGGTWKLAEADVFGELGLRLALAQYLGPAAAKAAADGWGGDGYALLQQGEGGPLALVMQSTWDDADEADQFWTLLQTYMEHRPGYTEKVEQLVGKLDGRWWTTSGVVAYGRQAEGAVTLVFAPDSATVEKLLSVLEEQ
jgi:tetratricopeptide (TPR) repeat protein